MPWGPEERHFIKKLKAKHTVEGVQKQVEEEIRKGLQGFIGHADTPTLRAQLQAYADGVCQRYNETMGHMLPGDFKIEITIPGGT